MQCYVSVNMTSMVFGGCQTFSIFWLYLTWFLETSKMILNCFCIRKKNNMSYKIYFKFSDSLCFGCPKFWCPKKSVYCCQNRPKLPPANEAKCIFWFNLPYKFNVPNFKPSTTNFWYHHQILWFNNIKEIWADLLTSITPGIISKLKFKPWF